MIDMLPVNQCLNPVGLSSATMDDATLPVREPPAPRAPRAPALARKIALPAPGTLRWVVRRKAAIVEAVKSGQLTIDDACRTYNLTPEEYLSWQRLIERHGTRGLRTTRLKDYRAENASQNKG
jgi:Protein of unknown function (DUF1153)